MESSSGNSHKTSNDTDFQQSTQNDAESSDNLPLNLIQTPDTARPNNDVDHKSNSTEESQTNNKVESFLASLYELQDVLQECENQIEEQTLIEKMTKNSEGNAEKSHHKNLPVIIAYPSKQRPKQPFMSQPPGQSGSAPPARPPPVRLPQAPSYYSPPVPRRPEPPHSQQPQESQPTQPTSTPDRTQKSRAPGFPIFIDTFMYPGNPLFFMPTALYNTVIWAPLPPKIPSNVPSCLAHLVVTDSFFIAQISWADFFSDLEEFFLIQNKNGECLYFVYETMDFGEFALCESCRAYRLHVLDMYQNEVIFIHKLSGCTSCCCYYPEMLVYAPPGTPVGVITKNFNFAREEYTLLDPDRNKMFKMFGPCCATCCCWTFEADFTIHALDDDLTEVGFIRREVGYLRSYTGSELFGLTLPMDMDVRVKAVFLVATIEEFKKGGEKDINKTGENNENLKMSAPSNSANVISFLQFIGKLKSLKRTGWVLRSVEDPETVSGHMYRMSIMTFLIPESTGVDKTRCMKLSLVHDLAECIVGDLTPYCGVNASEKHRQEEVAMKELTQMIGDSGGEIYKLYKEYEAQITDESKFVKDLDRLDMILQAFEYEKMEEKPGKLEEFFASTINKFHFPWTIDIVKEIYKQRNLHIKKVKV